ncbi:MBL fold metallo-hydrolase, partial [Mesorhizobium sp.]|uniref:MBL fold metallo-hydrolase n=1 Tax=Mesorhizobium sp. TaxID=1871066 RepID=UPI00356253BA
MAQTEHWEIYVIEFARSKNQPWVDLVNGMYDDGPTDLPFSFILARRGDRNVLVDTGFMKTETGPNFSDKFGIPWWISPVRMLAELGLAPDDITDIIVSHAHFDHMGSIDQFPKARLYLQK